MAQVHRIYYEVVGDGLKIADAHYAKVRERNEAAFELAKRYGAEGFRPNHQKGLRHLIFPTSEVPAGFRFAQREQAGRVSATPDKRTEVGKRAAAEMADMEIAPNGEDLAADLGYAVASLPMDGRSVFWPVAYRLLRPVERIFLDIPRSTDDGWTVPPHLIEVPASTFMLALEQHNAAARAEAA